MRGKAGLQGSFHNKRGITPAYAGKSLSVRQFPPQDWDHPRLCGEKYLAFDKSVPADRITPAYAGKSAFIPFLAFGTGDHPRLCGEKA